ncbi:DUF4145 domain-containing protein [Rhodobacterales bacterium HKCCE3408]|nr:DUF4145 domain-containing protein [Rhodobacterales bacterium HKCCE3408]
MAQVIIDCPNCPANSAAFSIVREYPSNVERAVWFCICECGACKGIILVKLLDANEKVGNANPLQPSKYASSGAIDERYAVENWWPSRSEPRIAQAIPENVERPLREAEQAFQSGLYSAAGSCYRKAIERAVKGLFPGGEGTLNSRIRKLERDGLLPPALIKLLDQVRIFGNNTLHEEDDDPTEIDCVAARDFCDLFFTYSYALPAKIDAAERRVIEPELKTVE